MLPNRHIGRMTQENDGNAPFSCVKQVNKHARRAEQLRRNLLKRKEQARARDEGTAPPSGNRDS